MQAFEYIMKLISRLGVELNTSTAHKQLSAICNAIHAQNKVFISNGVLGTEKRNLSKCKQLASNVQLPNWV